MAARRVLQDPLRSVPVKWKLTLMFASVGFVAFGVGGTLAWHTARRALEGSLVERLELRAKAWTNALDGHLGTLTRRVEDFASDGHIRTLTEGLGTALGQAERAELSHELDRHLKANKLPLEDAFVDLSIVGPAGEVLHAVHHPPDGQLALAIAGSTGAWVGPITTRADRELRIAIATPLSSLDGSRELGKLVAWISPGTWLVDALEPFRASSRGIDLRLSDGVGNVLTIPRLWVDAEGPRATSEAVRSGIGLSLGRAATLPSLSGIVRGFDLQGGGLRAEVALDPRRELADIAGLQSRFLLVGALLALATTLLLYFPLRYLVRPLGELTAAARKLHGGDHSVRVEVESEDEIGSLGSAFNQMAQAIEERTGRLERTAIDLREQRRTAGEERDRLRVVISSMRDGLVVLDSEGRPVVSNEAAAPLLRMIEGEELGALTKRNRCEANDRGRDCKHCLLSPDQGAQSCLVEYGAGIFEVHATRLGNHRPGQASGRVLVSRDVTDRIAQDERQIHQERLAVLGEVAAVFAHEVNNPLAAIRMYNQMLGAALPADSELQTHVEVIGRNTETCSRTIRELLDYATGATPQIQMVSVRDILEDVATFLRPLLERAEVAFTMELEDEDDPVELQGDEIQLRQIFVNLAMNALQATDRGGRVRVRCYSARSHSIVEFEDDGRGIPDELREHVFRPFFTTKVRGEGTGLGLPTARRIAELHGGGIELVESRPGKTSFRVRLHRNAAVAT